MIHLRWILALSPQYRAVTVGAFLVLMHAVTVGVLACAQGLADMEL